MENVIVKQRYNGAQDVSFFIADMALQVKTTEDKQLKKAGWEKTNRRLYQMGSSYMLIKVSSGFLMFDIDMDEIIRFKPSTTVSNIIDFYNSL